jgi:hypothetical protein
VRLQRTSAGDRFSPIDRARMGALAHRSAVEAFEEPGVRALRVFFERYPVVPSLRMKAFVASTLPAVLPRTWFQRYGVSPFAADLSVEIDTPKRYRAVVLRRPPAIRLTVDVERQASVRLTFGSHGSQRVFPGSLLDEVARTSRAVATVLQWSTDEAIAFIIRGEIPEPPILQVSRRTARDGSRAVRITVAPWLSPESVIAAYRQESALTHSGPRYRSARIFDLVSFVIARHGRDATGRAPWNVILPEWNAANPERSYTSARVMARDFRRAMAALNASPLLPREWR